MRVCVTVCAVVLCVDAAVPCVQWCIADPGSEFMLAMLSNQFMKAQTPIMKGAHHLELAQIYAKTLAPC